MRKKVDSRIRHLVENGVKRRHRSMFVIVGDRGRDQVVNLHHMLSRAQVRARPSVLWCYKKELGFSSNQRQRLKQLRKKQKRAKLVSNMDGVSESPFSLFLSSTNIRFSYYNETHKVLGQTFGMCVLQDFEALTPNLLARTLETVEGGGVIVLLLKTIDSLSQLFSLSMDVHSRYRTASHADVVPRFNERFILSLSASPNCLVVDDELNILPISSHARSIKALPPKENDELSAEEVELKELKGSLAELQPVGALVALARTLDQAKGVLTLIDTITEKSLRSTVAITASRGRGKSAALGVSMAAAIASGYSNIFVTSPSPENLNTLFEFVFKGFDALEFKEHLDYEIVQSTNPEFNNAIVRVNVFREHRQTIQYIRPQDSDKLGQAELVVIDEAAAIPLPFVKRLLGPYLVFMASTINGYEGTGRSLSLKLISQLREQTSGVAGSATSGTKSATGRVLREVALQEPIRYAAGDPVEKWLNQLLCLDCSSVFDATASSSSAAPKPATSCPHPSECELYYVNKDTLFSFHRASEQFLHRLMALYVSSHYKNTPNDLMLISDAPQHHLFVLLGPVDKKKADALPDILCVVQVCLEGRISKDVMLSALGRGERSAGDLIPWTISQQFQDNAFGSLSGARVVRIATHPEYQKMGYGSRALDLLSQYFEGELSAVDDTPRALERPRAPPPSDGSTLLTEKIAPRQHLPPLLQDLSSRPPEHLHYIGSSFGVTLPLFRFWSRAGYHPLYARQTANEVTGEHSLIVLRALNTDSVTPDWLKLYSMDFRVRFVHLLSYQFRSFPTALALSIASNCVDKSVSPLSAGELSFNFTPYDLKRLESYGKNLVDYHIVMDLMPRVATLYFSKRLRASLPSIQESILLALGLQHKLLSELEEEFSLPARQLLALFNKAVRKISSELSDVQDEEIAASIVKAIPSDRMKIQRPQVSLDEELEEAGEKQLRASSAALASADDAMSQLALKEYAIRGTDEDWDRELKGKRTLGAIVSIPKKRKREETEEDDKDEPDAKWEKKSKRRKTDKKEKSKDKSKKKKNKAKI
eukprot:TRINITY_DN576_c0_g1_i2.p1 TRINITY_DN576_c0_g1~~TRINITY_DN576_c0_g1_i2.p1  ORF type:complete len:1048 (+),score=416.78 TRINITY_DN576_c0_g1_i2:107-3250(+)